MITKLFRSLLAGPSSHLDSTSLKEFLKDHSAKPIFVCGCGHSGTTLVTEMLGHHPAIYALRRETGAFFGDIEREIPLSVLRQREIKQFEAKRPAYLCEKTPTHVHRIDEMRKLFPDAYFVIPVRDSRDVALSIKLRKGSLQEGYERWNRDNGAVRQQIKAGAKDVYVFKYEDLVDAPTKILTEICNRINLPFEARMLEFHDSKEAWFDVKDRIGNSEPAPTDHEKFRNWQLKQPLMDRRGRWKTMLSSDEIQQVSDACRPLMNFFGYA